MNLNLTLKDFFPILKTLYSDKCFTVSVDICNGNTGEIIETTCANLFGLLEQIRGRNWGKIKVKGYELKEYSAIISVDCSYDDYYLA